jgi:2-dehydro-3-deoxygalactonokinase
MAAAASRIDWIAVDWGTTHLRAWAMVEDRPLAARVSDRGMGKLKRSEFEPALVALLGDWLAESPEVIACGMVGSRQGWVEAPYRAAPCAPLGSTLAAAPTESAGLCVRVVPGIKQLSPPDVMRGEETQVAGFVARNPGWDGVLCLPGTHTKWVHLSAGEIVSFQTFMTGELFAVIGEHTVLHHSISTGDLVEWAFDQALDESLSRPERLASRLFTIRADSLLNRLAATEARSRLSGILIGAELAAAKPYWLGLQVAVLGAKGVAGLYRRALESQSVSVVSDDVEQATLAGLAAARRKAKVTA